MTAVARLRSWFLRNLLEAAERELGASALAGLVSRAPARVRPHLSLDRLRTTAALDAIPLDEGEDALLGLDQGLGEGNGRLLERVAREMFARQLVQAAAAVRVGDLYGTVARLRGPLEHPFLDTELTFELERNEGGFTLTVGVPGRPRATRLLRHIAIGAILAAERFARESQAEPLRIQGDTFADRARIEAHFRRTSDVPPTFEPSPTSARRSSGSRLAQPSLSDEVARILDPSLALGRARSEQDEPHSKKPSSPDITVVKVPSPADLGPVAPPSQRRPTVPPPPVTSEAKPGPKQPAPVDPRGVTYPALKRASSKPPPKA